MPLMSGSHEMFGELILERDASELLEEWFESGDYDNEYQRRDKRWWLEATFVPDGKRLRIYEKERSNHRVVERRVEQAGDLAEAAESGWIVVQHFENGVSIHRWEIADGSADETVEHTDGDGVAVPGELRDVVDHFHRETDRQDELFESRAPEERFEEVVVRYAATMPYIVAHGGDRPRRRAALERLTDVVPEPHTRWESREELGDEGTLIIPDLDALSDEELQTFSDLVDQREAHVLTTSGEDPMRTLPGPLVFKFSQGTIDLSTVHPSVSSAD